MCAHFFYLFINKRYDSVNKYYFLKFATLIRFAQLYFLFCDRITRIRALIALLVPRVWYLPFTSQIHSLPNYSRIFVHQWNRAAASCLQCTYLGNRKKQGKAKGRRVGRFKLLAAGRKGDPYSVRENYDSLFRASPSYERFLP